MFIHFHNFEGMISDTVQRGAWERVFNKILNTENTRWKPGYSWLRHYLGVYVLGFVEGITIL